MAMPWKAKHALTSGRLTLCVVVAVAAGVHVTTLVFSTPTWTSSQASSTKPVLHPTLPSRKLRARELQGEFSPTPARLAAVTALVGSLTLVVAAAASARRRPTLSCRKVFVCRASSNQERQANTETLADINFKDLAASPLAQLEELYIDSLWQYYRADTPLLKDDDFNALKKELYRRESKFPTLNRTEVAFIEAAIAYYRGQPVVSDEEWKSLKAQVTKSGRRKDVTAFLLYERGEQLLDGDAFKNMKDEYEKLGVPIVNLEDCSRAQLEEMYVDVIWSYYNDGVQLLSDDQYDKLKMELEWEGSGFPFLRSYEIKFVKASLSYWRGKPKFSDEEWQELKRQVKESGSRKDVTAFLLYSKGQQELDGETFKNMRAEMAKLGVDVRESGAQARKQLMEVSSADNTLSNDIVEVASMYSALFALPFVICTAFAWFLSPSLGVSSIAVGVLGGAVLTSQLVSFLDLQDAKILKGRCPSCESELKLGVGGAAQSKEVAHKCIECGLKMTIDAESQRIVQAGVGSKVGSETASLKEDEDWQGWRQTWLGLKRAVRGGPRS
eukprot:TRINITY_DN13431_c0_g2_i1.p1 TRINITY_DN13431_c0_g2~~TRINITY_DN13431_c0_g2_i1.p1  ORF type:complete len:555 (+),score=102.87 TRINITY_DN13431_c0_g2_i1:73-1737(+)